MSAVREETRRAERLLGTVEELEGIAETFEEDDTRRATLHDAIKALLTDLGPVRVSTASALLSLSTRTVRSWVSEGLLEAVAESPRKLDPVRLHHVLHLVRDLRDAGTDRNLLDAVWYRLQDEALLEREDLQESVEQMRRGEGATLVEPPSS